ncbi:GNAT family N-acetyltransferase [Devosia sp. ZB163]|uniref:lipid II:glycine glycyltransferase FemX n=1 Tax=Devosia sp. ZB163 TaxID=3025938 RepID=UPI00236126C8|nr:GNAT family N-acetyltransferase [Devosia sp. ZB163]MDC9824139.1 GNAT family N-acetyltransferase [Devosia sp. ZB163]
MPHVAISEGIPVELAAPRAATSSVSMRVVTPAEWDETIADFDGACQEQLATFALARWPGVALEPQVFVRNGEIVGGCLIMVQPLPLRLGSVAVAKWAPMLRRNGTPDADRIYSQIVDALTAEYADRRRMMLSILPRASLEAENAEYAHLAGRGFREGSSLLFPNRYIVNLRLSDAEQRSSFHQKWRYHLNKSDKAGLRFEHAPADRLADFTRLYEQMVDRKKFPDHSAYDTVAALMTMANETLRPELFFVWHGDELVAGAVIFKAGDRAVYLYGATTAAALDLRAGYFLHWHIIRWLRDNTRASWYDLGGTDGFHGLHQFKKGMVGDRGVISPVPPVANYARHWWPRLMGECAFAARGAIQALARYVDRLRPDRAKPDQKRSDD